MGRGSSEGSRRVSEGREGEARRRAAHLTQVSWPSASLKVPGSHGVAAVLPTAHLVPARQVMHCETSVITGSEVSMRVPLGHGSGAAAPSPQ